MTVTLSATNEKSSAAPAPDLPTVTGWSRYNNAYLKSKCGKLKVAEIVLGLLALLLIRPRHQDSNIEYVFLFLTFNAPLLTALDLWDGLNGEKLRKLLVLDVDWEQLELRYNGIAALLYYTGSFGMLTSFIGHYNPQTNILAGVIGMLTCFAYAYNWWLMYRERVLKGVIAAKVQEFTQSQTPNVVHEV